MNVGSVFAYEPTQSIATNGAKRQRATITRTGVITGCFSSVTSVTSDIRRFRPLTYHQL